MSYDEEDDLSKIDTAAIRRISEALKYDVPECLLSENVRLSRIYKLVVASEDASEEPTRHGTILPPTSPERSVQVPTPNTMLPVEKRTMLSGQSKPTEWEEEYTSDWQMIPIGEK